jgi:hypothetical protein
VAQWGRMVPRSAPGLESRASRGRREGATEQNLNHPPTLARPGPRSVPPSVLIQLDHLREIKLSTMCIESEGRGGLNLSQGLRGGWGRFFLAWDTIREDWGGLGKIGEDWMRGAKS